jgi:glycosyltransferase involved in cell wall biosynthesis
VKEAISRVTLIPKVLFLYTEIADYFLACCRELVNAEADVHVVCWPVNPEAPFQFKEIPGVRLYNRKAYDAAALERLAAEIEPAVIVCSGWIDKGYLKLCRQFKNSVPTVLIMDNQWRGSFKQHIACLASPFYLMSKFSHCWVPGRPQYRYARKLGFSTEKIMTGFYSADTTLFNELYEVSKREKENDFPRRFIYVGRYHVFKGIKDLWKAFVELQDESPNEWELWCLGTGDVKPLSHPKIRHFGFVQPSAIGNFIKDTGVFVLPSHKEPWGVAVHEFAAAGFPFVCSDRVGAADQFVEEGLNGYIYGAGNVDELKHVLRKVMSKNDQELKEMGRRSHELAQAITPTKWAATLNRVMQISSH